MLLYVMVGIVMACPWYVMLC